MVLIGLGSNKAWLRQEPAVVIRKAARALETLGSAVTLSPLYDSPAWPDSSQPRYTNAVARMTSQHHPEALLAALLTIEAAFGRVRSDDPAKRYAPRTLDLDLLAVGDAVVESTTLTLPHPRIAERDFVLLPLRDVAPDWTHPVTGQGAAAMVEALPGVTARPL